MYISETILEVRYYETDLMGIVHHSNYIRYFECGRSEALANLGLPIHQIEKLGIMMPVVNVACDYKLPAKLGDKLRVVSTVNEIPKARMQITGDQQGLLPLLLISLPRTLKKTTKNSQI